MTTTKLTLAEIYALDYELFGNGENKGLVAQPLSIKVKYWLNRLAELIKSEVATIEEIRNNLLKELQEEENDEMPLKMDNPKVQKLQAQFDELLTEEKEITHAVFTLEQFEHLEATEYYEVFFKLIQVTEN